MSHDVHILFDLRNKLEELPKDKTIYVSCQVGLRGYLASRILKNSGFHVKNVDGGWKTYSSVKGGKDVGSQNKHQGTKPAQENTSQVAVDKVVDVRGLTCPMPIMKLKTGLDQIQSGQVLEIHVTDRGALNDLPLWANKEGHSILNTVQEEKVIKFLIQKK